MSENKNVYYHYFISNKDTTFLVIRDSNFEEKIIEEEKKNLKEIKNFSLVFDFENLSKELNFDKVSKFIEKDNKPINLIIKNCLIKEEISCFFKKLNLNLTLLYISDELYRMSPNLNILFDNVKTNKLVLKKIKINSKLQLDNFLNFIINTGCEELTLEDIFIELIVKNDENDETYNELNKYFYFESGEIKIKNINEKNGKIKKLTMIDCPLFIIKKDTFKNINNYKDILIDIDENSLLNPSFITKFKINDGYTDICFDLDSYKLNEDKIKEEKNKEKDYIDYLDDLFNIIINDNCEMKRISFKNFDVTKYEYISGENLTFIDEKNWVLNIEEEERKKKYEDYEESINKRIDENKDKLSNVKELIFDNCSNDFMKLILKFKNSTKNLDYLKIKKCGKDYFNLKNILSLNIKKLVLFDTPLIIDYFPKNNESHLGNFKGEKGRFKDLTIKISSLEHYCVENNLDYYRTIEIIVELINDSNFNQHLCFEMNALPIIMTFLFAKYYNEKTGNLKEKYMIPIYFELREKEGKIEKEGKEEYENENVKTEKQEETKEKIETEKTKEEKEEEERKKKEEEQKNIERKKNAAKTIQKRDAFISKSFILQGLEEKENLTIVLKNNNIKNRLDNFDFYYYAFPNLERGKDLKSDYGKDIFNIDLDYRSFFILNKVRNIIFESCLFNDEKYHLYPKSTSETIANIIRETKKNYTFDMESLNELVYKNNDIQDISFLLKYCQLSLNEKIKISLEIHKYLRNLESFFFSFKNLFVRFKKYIKKITIRLNNIKELKEFYCMLIVLKYDQEEIQLTHIGKDTKSTYMLLNQAQLKKELECHFLKTKNENDEEVCSGVLNYYYISKEEKDLFWGFNKKEITLNDYKFTIEYKFKDPWDIITI